MSNMDIPFYQDSTRSRSDWHKMLKQRPKRVSIITEGDSWFAYPHEWLICNPPINVTAHMDRLSRNNLNRLRLEANGDILLKMLSTSGLTSIRANLKWPLKHGCDPVDFLMISGTGNDIAGTAHPEFDLGDFASYLNEFQNGFGVKKCINQAAFDKAFTMFETRLDKLAKTRDNASPTTCIVCHCYDYAYPTGLGAVFMGGMIKMDAWLKPYMVKRNIPDRLHRGIVKYLINRIASLYENFAANNDNILFVDTRKTLTKKSQWLNELHPTEAGFKIITRKIYTAMRKHNPKLKPLPK
jgi:hypothetical protein